MTARWTCHGCGRQMESSVTPDPRDKFCLMCLTNIPVAPAQSGPVGFAEQGVRCRNPWCHSPHSGLRMISPGVYECYDGCEYLAEEALVSHADRDSLDESEPELSNEELERAFMENSGLDVPGPEPESGSWNERLKS